MVKLLGSVLVLFASTYAGFYMANRFKQRVQNLLLFVSGLQMLETEIFYGATPLPIACTTIGLRLAKPVGDVFSEFGARLHDGEGATADQLWQQTLKARQEHLSLKERDLQALHHFGRTLGVSDREDQIKHIRLAISHLTSEEVIAREEQAKNEKMWRYLGALLGLTVVILLY